MDTLFTNLLRLIIDLGLFTVPVVIIGAWIGQYPLGLDYRVFELVFGLALAFLVRFIVTDLRTNWFVGGAMIVLYLIMCVSFFFHADD
jgi:Ca2+/H+ antiporter